ncbi:MAG TPA: hypothetical protein VK609_03395, partial [Mucilaginibacter sp.]|nr:hypothetical protein [Mucilaginibacter sp.]
IKNDYLAYAGYAKSMYKPFFKIHYYCNINFRLSHFFFHLKLLPISRLFWLFNRIIFSIDIDPGATLKGGFVIIHGIGIVIGRYVVSEGQFKIFHGATLGGNNGKEAVYNNKVLKQPYLKDNITIGINSSVLGPITIGSGVIIGSHAIVTKDVSDDCTIVGNNKVLK